MILITRQDLIVQSIDIAPLVASVRYHKEGDGGNSHRKRKAHLEKKTLTPSNIDVIRYHRPAAAVGLGCCCCYARPLPPPPPRDDRLLPFILQSVSTSF